MYLNEKEKQTLQRFKEILTNQLKENVIEIQLFGSRARGDAKEDSDIDVLVILREENLQLLDQIYEVVTDILLETGTYISPKVLSKEEFDSLSGTEFIKNIEKDSTKV